MSGEQVVDFIQGVGFPIAVASFVLVRLNGKFGKLTDAVNRLCDIIEGRLDLTEKNR